MIEDILNADAAAGSPRWRTRGIEPASVRAVPLSAGVYDYPEEVGRRIVPCLRVPAGPRDATTRGRTRSTGSSPTSTSPTARSTRMIDIGRCRRPGDLGQLRRPRGAGPAAGLAEADRDHPARGPQLHGRGQPGALGEVGPARRVQRARGPDPAPDRFDGRPDRLPGVDRRDGGALRRPGAGAVLAELLRLRRVHVRPLRRLAASSAATASATSTTSTPSSPTTSAARRRSRNAICMHEEDYGVLWKHSDLFTELARDAPPAPAGDLVLHPDRQLRLRLLLVPLPRRHHPARGQGHRHRVHRRLPRGRQRRTPPRSLPGSARPTTSTCSRPGWT